MHMMCWTTVNQAEEMSRVDVQVRGAFARDGF